MNQAIDMQVIRHYPPDVQAMHERYFDLMDYFQKRMISAAQSGIVRTARPEETARTVQRLQSEYIAACEPIINELASLEMLATVTYVMRRP